MACCDRSEPPRTDVRSVRSSDFADAAAQRAARICAGPAAIAAVVPLQPADGETNEIVTIFLPPAASDAKRALVQAALARELAEAYPGFRFNWVINSPPMFDGVTDEVYFTPPPDLRVTGKVVKRLKQEVLAGSVSSL